MNLLKFLCERDNQDFESNPELCREFKKFGEDYCAMIAESLESNNLARNCSINSEVTKVTPWGHFLVTGDLTNGGVFAIHFSMSGETEHFFIQRTFPKSGATHNVLFGLGLKGILNAVARINESSEKMR